jgi:hypothetical protein
MMSEHEQKNDPWASLAESLGAKPVSKPTPPPPAASAPPMAAMRPSSMRSTTSRAHPPGNSAQSAWISIGPSLDKLHYV